MKKEIIHLLLRTDQIRIRQLDIERIKSMINSAQTTVNIVKNVPFQDSKEQETMQITEG